MRKLALILALTLLPAAAANACPNCRDSIANNDTTEASNLPAGFNHSIYFMLGGFFVVSGLLVRMLVKESRNGVIR